MCGLRRIVRCDGFSVQFIGEVSRFWRVGCNIDVLQRTACLVVAVGGFAFLFDCAPVGQASASTSMIYSSTPNGRHFCICIYTGQGLLWH